MVQELRRVDFGKDDLCDGGDKRPARKRRPMVAGVYRVGDLLAHENGPDGQTAAKWLGDGHDVGFGFTRVGPQFARAADSTLNLIIDEQCIVLIAECPDFLQVCGISDAQSTFALDGFNDDCTDIARYQ